MKKIVLFIVILAATTDIAKSQDIFNEIRKTAKEKTENPVVPDMIKQVNRFKVDALDYLLLKMREQMPDSTTAYLDKQAYAMNNFINFYMSKIIEAKERPQAYQLKLLQLFMDASYSNPLFNDTDRELTLIYFSDSESLTRFSLDTDWRRAAAAVMFEVPRLR
ncbi:hypothetical protein [Xylanibacter muris]|uniref:Uncharacterized protein n=1 Tax=Xylanibacter muris TaxID=2736290 RepID=A0ABX2ANQ7_9BACT|nr:hypothetical protein [Xylanibacter muris]NPD92765.1 hypothetical protein [Xylanibacter muris]